MEQVFAIGTFSIRRGFRIIAGKIVAISPADKANEYIGYMEHCLTIARSLPDRKDRIVHREMAAEWVRLAQMMTEDAAHGAHAIRSAVRRS